MGLDVLVRKRVHLPLRHGDLGFHSQADLVDIACAAPLCAVASDLCKLQPSLADDEGSSLLGFKDALDAVRNLLPAVSDEDAVPTVSETLSKSLTYKQTRWSACLASLKCE